MSTQAQASQDAEWTREAPALPAKRGELGYVDRAPEVDLSSGSAEVLNAGPHPAEHNGASTSSSESAPHQGESDRPRGATSNRSRGTTPVPDPGQKAAVFQSWRSTKPNRRFGGLANATVLRLAAILVAIGAVVVIWVFAAKVLQANARIAGGYSNDPSAPDMSPVDATPSLVFVHISFSVAILILLIFLERAVFRARVDRFAYKNPGVLPQYRYRGGLRPLRAGRSSSDSQSWGSIPYAPWNRPPLPTYAAAMNARGTGDVEDEIIAAPPPPAYGNTRGSTLLLTGLPGLREGQRVPDSPPPPMSDDGHGGDTSRRASRRASVASSLRSFISALGRSRSDNNITGSSSARVEAISQTLAKLEEGQAAPKPETSTSRQA
ncbi:hypothetical protein M407DRAFT_192319 [Tulasnella calospora MUT 4182]|uniref:Transmembrane protein n=1 Tax=Tulasnella calospora MUT 4182 TaxID=1051891 RepID=A0A0C3QV87_9AGAM|nr:hypothetical protein M407DRAFT_192319 [Tulasnella calospora MUT 4182]